MTGTGKGHEARPADGAEATVRTLDDGFPVSHIAPPLSSDGPTIESVERRRAHLWLVAALLLVSFAIAILLLFIGGDIADLLPDVPALRWASLALSVAFMLYVVDQERRLRHLTSALIDERVLTSALRARITDLAALTRVGRVVNSVLDLEEVLEVILGQVFDLTEATAGSVMLRDGDELIVAASAGEGSPARGTPVTIGTGVAGWVAERREPVLITGELQPGQFPGHTRRDRPAGSSVIAPLIVGDELLGVLAVERPPESPAFTETQLRSVAVFAEHVATAVANAERYDEERSTVRELADVLEQRADFVATMVHELKTPLTVMIGFVHVLESRWQGMDARRRQEILRSVRVQGERMREMVEEILQTSSVEAGAELRRDPVDLPDLLTAVIDRIGTSAAEREDADRLIRLLGADREAVLAGDHEALARVFENLLGNAVKYSPPGTPVEVALDHDEDVVRVAVVDHGPGVPEEERDSIFERFRRAGPLQGNGVGLGLYIVRTLVRSHGGKVWVEPTEGGGATFVVELPRRQPSFERSASSGVPARPAEARR